MDNKITPPPWKLHDMEHATIVADHVAVADCNAVSRHSDTNQANAAYIVMACNMHGELLEALERVDELWSVDALDYSEEMHMDSPVGKVWALVKNAISKTTLVGGDNGKNS